MTVGTRRRVLVVGPDGSGKSTVAAELSRRAEALGLPVLHAHWRPGLLFPIGKSAGPITDPHRRPARGSLLSIARLALLIADQVVGILGPWRRAAARGLLIIERGWLDMAVDPVRYRLPSWTRPIIVLAARAIARVDLVILLSGDPEVLDGRTGEIGVPETARQIETWRQLAPGISSVVIELDTTRDSPDQVVRQAWSAVRHPHC